MGQLKLLLATLFVSYAHGTMVNPDSIDLERFTMADSKSARIGTVYKSARDNVALAASRPTNIVYGKSKSIKPGPSPYIAPNLKGKPIVSKFKPSQEDTGYDSDGFNAYAHGYKPTPQETAALQKYMQRYASQVISAQKHAGQQSEAQKHIVSSDPYKKYTAPTDQKYKFIPVIRADTYKSSDEKVKDHDTVEINTEKYQSVQVHQHVVVQPSKSPKSPPKKAYSSVYDNAQQSSDYKYSSEDSHLASQLLAEPEKDSWSSYEPYQYGLVSAEKSAELSKITGYKIPATSSVTLGHSVETKEEEKGHDDEHYEHHEPKYEYMYQVHDPEKHNNFGHSEARKGKTTWGRYYVQLPDGRLETVKYWVDKSGYHAEVDFKGQAKHPSHKEYVHEEPAKTYTKSEDVGLGGHSESSYSISEGEEY